ncbi:hypothetical protein ZIOFF_004101 [Zingiber officinale]|uniref:Uncharacterized protein n=1 Tax=Zingiber officinale TaxID=94328 RepID=A0A8J5LTY7_ZINOF|nr:hypothetical protein ZIOFF_004101 [Zingiber officinale]
MSSARETLIRMPSCGSLRSLTSMQRHFRLFAVTCFSPEQQSGVGDGASPCTYCMHVDSPNSWLAHSARSLAKSDRAAGANTATATAAAATTHLQFNGAIVKLQMADR